MKFKPSQTDIKYTNVTIQGLDPNTEYQFVIYSKNNYSNRINETNWGRIAKKIKTEGEGKDLSVVNCTDTWPLKQVGNC